MQTSDILTLRLHNTGLSNSPFNNAREAVSHLGAVQAQDFSAAKWSLGLRIKNSTDKNIEKDFDDGSILRVHVMRPTWHFILPEDISWMIELTAPRLKASLASYNIRLGLDEAVFAKCNQAVVNAFKGQKYLTRQEIKAILEEIGIKTSVQTLAHIIMRTELDGLICSGPRRGKQFTYAFTEERVKNPKKLDREQALATLARRYFNSHGPAQLEDFSWWSGLTAKDAKTAVDLVKSELRSFSVNGKTYWYPENAKTIFPKPPTALLLSIYDEYTIAYKDRSSISEARDIERMISMGNALTAVIIFNGRVEGTWSKALSGKTVKISLHPFHELNKTQQKAIEAQIARYSQFTGIPVISSGHFVH